MQTAAWASLAAAILLASRGGAAPAPRSWSEAPGVRWAALTVRSNGQAGFTPIPAEHSGVAFTNQLEGDLYLTNAVAHNGSGLALGDIDGDGWTDIYFCNLQGPNRLYRNLGGWRFAEMDAGPAACAGQLSTGAAFADVDGDRDLDLLVNGISAGTRLFLNDGGDGWREMEGSGLSRTNSATSLALGDIDGDGDLDLYSVHYIDVMHLADPTTRFALRRRDGRWEVVRVNGQSTRTPRWRGRFEALPDGSVRELPEAHALYRNEGGGRFTAIQNAPGTFADAAGNPMAPPRDWGLAAMFRDVDGDLDPDLYVCNDFASPDRFWINEGGGRFKLADAFQLRHTSRSSMGIDFADVNRDGLDDFIVLDMFAREHDKRLTQLSKGAPDTAERERREGVPRFSRNTLFLARPDGAYMETAFFAGVAATDWSWCPIFLDVDLDGFEDLLVSNGFSFDVMDQDSEDQLRRMRLSEAEQKRSRKFRPRWATANAAFRNRGDGTFEARPDWNLGPAGISYGMALGDLDNDGDLDVAINNLNEAATLLRNDASGERIAVRLRGRAPNTRGIGARIELTGAALAQAQEMIAGGRYMSGDQPLRLFAAPGGGPLRLKVSWRDGTQTLISNVEPNRIYEIAQTNTVPRPSPPAEPKPLFADASALLNHEYTEAPFDDWLRQPLLPRAVSRNGPSIAWSDLDGDGWEDLAIGASRGRGVSIFKNKGGKAFDPLPELAAGGGDSFALAGWPAGKSNFVIAAVSNEQTAPGVESKLLAFALPAENGAPPLQARFAGPAALGPMALADIDGDGDLDLFAGGRFIPGRWPEAAPSAIWLNESGALTRGDSWSEPFAEAGLVNGAVFTDLNNDGALDLAFAVEWGPIRLFQNRGGRYEEVTEAWGLAEMTGLWQGIATGDFDGDGRLDLAAANFGRNTPCELYGGPIRLYYGDFGPDGALGIIEAWRDSDRWLPIRDRLWLQRGIPDLARRFPTHQAFARAAIPEILGPAAAGAGFLEVRVFESSVFLNRGGRFERLPLPDEAQFTPAFSIQTADFDADGTEDLFLSQNFFGTASDFYRGDAGRGLLLRGLGEGKFAAVDGSVSGIKVHGEQRGAAVADFNHDGRMDIAVGQNNGPTRLFLNQHDRNGVRVVLEGPPENPKGIGARLRLVYSDGSFGPVRLVQAGSGYLSQNAAAQILGSAGELEAVSVRWPGGREQTVAIPPDPGQVTIQAGN